MLDHNLNKPKLILLGGGGHCLSVIDVVERENRYLIKGILDSSTKNKEILGYPILGGDDEIRNLIDDNTFFLITVGQIKNYAIREKISFVLKKSKAQLAKVISPLAYVSKHAVISEGTIIMHHSFVNAAAEIGKHCIINTKANIEHNVKIEDFCHISTGAIVNGDSLIKKGTFVGSNATISNGIIIEKNSVISAGKFIK
ncbi:MULTISPECIES: NeuD/PglB/VioB family sugar acetyltransferase [unclassified Polaribacter]|uniref:NeuD/PglB/VioB family sugar acetyltransferase n=1 Tax=unclassified Polaribacter TaxID=196858 RepID=UPI0011BD64B8|nr:MULTISPECIES: NeuD/PglB/VioB family sugar acetyltransferase [unclassified Polaribacter]TXD49012.1 acetyltransferase [Polaribacter sp. IC063]TXD57191.1 acetyltransferase [Polaribacter sp. IC066]